MSGTKNHSSFDGRILDVTSRDTSDKMFSLIYIFLFLLKVAGFSIKLQCNIDDLKC